MEIKKILLQTFRNIAFNKKAIETVVVIDPTSNDVMFNAIKTRLSFFSNNKLIIERTKQLSLIDTLNHKIIAYTGDKPPYLLYRVKHEQIFNLNYDTNADDGWEYHRILALISKNELNTQREKSRAKLAALKKKLVTKFNKAYIFGTGPSLEKSLNQDWDDGIRIVSNTIVKDKELWNHLKPHFIVAGDAIYHFGISEFAKSFRKDLAARMAETDTYFIFQEHFYPFVKQNFPQFEDRLIPIPMGSSATFYDLVDKLFELPAVGNVLNNLLLPLACYLTDNIYLWGFDGRGPTDKLFWKNSDKHFYSDLIPQLQKLHPAFFDVLVPKDNPSSYVLSVHGDLLNNMLTEAEEKGKTFKMMHPSYTKTLMDRYEPLV